MSDDSWLVSERAQDFYIQAVLNRTFDRADEDYVAARVLYWNNLMGNFIWAAQQSLEKYLKAALLFRRKEVLNEHDLKWHFKQLIECADVELEKVLKLPCKAAALPQQKNEKGRVTPWKFTEETSQFISRFSKMGSSRSRYNEVDLIIQGYDLLKFDAVCKMIRCACLEFPIGERRSVVIHRDVSENPDRLERFYFGRTKMDAETFRMVRRRNFSYFTESTEPEENLGYMSIRNHEGERSIYRGDKDFEAAHEFLETRFQSRTMIKQARA